MKKNRWIALLLATVILISAATQVVLAENDANVVLSARNMATVQTTLTNTLNVYDLMKAEKVVLTKDAVAKIEEVYA